MPRITTALPVPCDLRSTLDPQRPQLQPLSPIRSRRPLSRRPASCSPSGRRAGGERARPDPSCRRFHDNREQPAAQLTRVPPSAATHLPAVTPVPRAVSCIRDASAVDVMLGNGGGAPNLSRWFRLSRPSPARGVLLTRDSLDDRSCTSTDASFFSDQRLVAGSSLPRPGPPAGPLGTVATLFALGRRQSASIQ